VNDMGLATRSSLRLRSDDTRVLSRLFIPGQELIGGSESRAANTVERILALKEVDVDVALEDLFDRFDHRHEDLGAVFDAHAQRVDDYVTTTITRTRAEWAMASYV
jgi:hypothetical protein